MDVEVAWAEVVDVRELGAADASAVAAMVGRCSPDTLYRRFHAPRPDAAEVLAADVRRREPLSRRHLGAFTGGRLVGLASLVPAVGAWEVAVLVEDSWQRRGVGRALATRLGEAAREQGVACIRLTVLNEAAETIRALLRAARWRIVRGTLFAGVLEMLTEPA